MRICLIGFQGSGKSSIGKEVAKILKIPFYDTDEELSRQFCIPIPLLFRKVGEQAFRALEENCLRALSSQPQVIACGGGVTRAVSCLLPDTAIIYLYRPFDRVWDEIVRKNSVGTPPAWLQESCSFTLFESCWRERHPLFLLYASHLFRVYKRSVVDDARRLISIL